MLPPEHSLLNGLIIERLEDVFRLHGAVDMEPTLLVPVGRTEDLEKAVFLDKYGDALMLPDHGLLPMARLAERSGKERIKRFHVGDVYKSRYATVSSGDQEQVLMARQASFGPSADSQVRRV
jgi:translation initiation factor 2-alpha kinase 4